MLDKEDHGVVRVFNPARAPQRRHTVKHQTFASTSRDLMLDVINENQNAVFILAGPKTEKKQDKISRDTK